jgi:hypothetical protein
MSTKSGLKKTFSWRFGPSKFSRKSKLHLEVWISLLLLTCCCWISTFLLRVSALVIFNIQFVTTKDRCLIRLKPRTFCLEESLILTAPTPYLHFIVLPNFFLILSNVHSSIFTEKLEQSFRGPQRQLWQYCLLLFFFFLFLVLILILPCVGGLVTTTVQLPHLLNELNLSHIPASYPLFFFLLLRRIHPSFNLAHLFSSIDFLSKWARFWQSHNWIPQKMYGSI